MHSAYPSLSFNKVSDTSNNTVKKKPTKSIFNPASASPPLSNRQIVLIHDPPILLPTYSHNNTDQRVSYSDEAQIDSQLLGEMVTSLTVPVVIIMSDMSGREEINYVTKQCISNMYRTRYLFTLTSIC